MFDNVVHCIHFDFLRYHTYNLCMYSKASPKSCNNDIFLVVLVICSKIENTAHCTDRTATNTRTTEVAGLEGVRNRPSRQPF